MRDKIRTDDLEIAGVDRWADSAVVLRCRFRVAPLEQWNVRREFLRRLKKAFDAHGIEIPFPHVTVYAGAGKDGAAPPFHWVATQEPPQAEAPNRKDEAVPSPRNLPGQG